MDRQQICSHHCKLFFVYGSHHVFQENATYSLSKTPTDIKMRYMSFLEGCTSNTSNGITLLGLTKNLKKLKKELQTIFKRRNTRSNLTNNRKKP